MTPGEMFDVIEFHAERERAKAEAEYNLAKQQAELSLKNAALTAYFSGAYSRRNIQLPETLRAAFPSLFNEGESQQPDWMRTYIAMEKMRERFLARKKEKENADNG